MPRLWIQISFFFLVVTAILGAFLRFLLISPINGINYKHFLHGHSHVAFMGWIFNALFAIIIYLFLPDDKKVHKPYSLLFWILQAAVIGMMITFPIQGYAALSISFSTLHVVTSYWFAFKVWKDIKTSSINSPSKISIKFIRWSLVFMVLSSIGPFALGYIMAQGFSGSYYYQLAIYFYLHFQYNGWFVFAILGILFRWMEIKSIAINEKLAKYFVRFMLISCLLGYALSAYWIKPPAFVYLIGTISVILQLAAMILFIRILWNVKGNIKGAFSNITYSLLMLSLFAFVLKSGLQILSALPEVADLAFRFRNFTIAYLHLVFIGFASLFIFAWFHEHAFIKFTSKPTLVSLVMFIISFVASQFLLILQPLTPFGGINIYTFHISMFILSSILAASLLTILVNSLLSLRPYKVS